MNGVAAETDIQGEMRGGHLFVSNRSPYLYRKSGHTLKVSKAIGGLVSTMEPAFRRLGGLWIGAAPGCDSDTRTAVPGTGEARCFSKHVNLTDEEIELYYNGFANSSLWSLCHEFLDRFEFREKQWQAYRRVNQKFANAICNEVSSPDNVVWIHDYHLCLTPEFVRHRNPALSIACFWHIPFPKPQVLARLPRATEVLTGLLNSCLIGFHLNSYAINFVECVRRQLPEAVVDRGSMQIHLNGRTTAVRAVPLGIDFKHWDREASSPAALRRAASLRADLNIDHLALGVDRLDYTKGILERIEAVRLLMERNASMRGRFTLAQLGVPTRTGLEVYRELQDAIEREVRNVNRQYGTPGWVPIILKIGLVPQDELAVWYRAADLALVTPIRDGMNLVAKEFVASRGDLDAVLILGRGAGVAEELGQDALLVDPANLDDTASAIETALSMDRCDVAQCMRRMRETVRRHDLSWWLRSIADVMQCGRVRNPVPLDASIVPMNSEG